MAPNPNWRPGSPPRAARRSARSVSWTRTGVVEQLASLLYRAQKRRNRQVLLSTHSAELLRDGGIGGEEVLLLTPGREGTDIAVSFSLRDVQAVLAAGASVGDAVISRIRPAGLTPGPATTLPQPETLLRPDRGLHPDLNPIPELRVPVYSEADRAECGPQCSGGTTTRCSWSCGQAPNRTSRPRRHRHARAPSGPAPVALAKTGAVLVYFAVTHHRSPTSEVWKL